MTTMCCIVLFETSPGTDDSNMLFLQILFCEMSGPLQAVCGIADLCKLQDFVAPDFR